MNYKAKANGIVSTNEINAIEISKVIIKDREIRLKFTLNGLYTNGYESPIKNNVYKHYVFSKSNYYL